MEREDTPLDEDGKYDFESIHAIDTKLLNNDLLKLLNGEEIEAPTFNFHTGHKEYKGNKMKLASDEVLIMEGIHCLNDELTYLIPKEQKYKIYISALTVLNIDYYNRISTTDTRLIRRIESCFNVFIINVFNFIFFYLLSGGTTLISNVPMYIVSYCNLYNNRTRDNFNW